LIRAHPRQEVFSVSLGLCGKELLVTCHSSPSFDIFVSISDDNLNFADRGSKLPVNSSSHTAYTIEVEVHLEYVHARVTADHVDRATAMSFLSDVLMECAKHRLKRLILERDNPGVVVEVELFYIMDDLLKLKDETKIAFLNRHLLHAEEIRDVVAYGANLGGNYRCFNSFESAEQWLLEDSDEK